MRRANIIFTRVVLCVLSIISLSVNISFSYSESSEDFNGKRFSKRALPTIYKPILKGIPSMVCTPAISGSIISAIATGNNLSYSTVYVLTDALGNIITTNGTGSFTAPSVSSLTTYQIYAVNYDPNATSLPNLSSGNQINSIGGSCVATSLPKCFEVSPSSCASVNTVSLGSALSATISGNNTGASYTTQYVLTDGNDIILNGPSNTASFTPTSLGNYRIYAVNYSGTINNLSVGKDILTDVSGACFAVSAPKCFLVSIFDTDGDGDPDNTDPAPNNSCVWGTGQVLANTTTAWRTSDCDGDGVTNYKEATGTDNDPLTTADNTNPNDGCSYNKVDQVFANTSAGWKALDCDKDGNPNGTDPNPQTATAANDVLTANFGVTSTVNILSNDDFLAGVNTSITKTGGTAGGTVSFNASTGVMSYTPTASEPGNSVTVIYQVCNTATTPNVCASATVTISVPLAGDQDGDGDPDNTDPQPTNPCVWSSSQVLANTTTAWRNADCDGDGVTNYKEATGTDNDPLTTADNTNPNDGCSYNKVDQVFANTSAGWKALDCDKDGNPNGTDPNPQTATAANDVLTANFGVTSTVNVLSNDDFLAGVNTSITKTGGTAGGTVSFNASTGVMSYTPTASEPGSSVTVVYQVCNTATTPNVCASATVTISVPAAGDQDGDGDPDNTDPQPTNSCVWSSSQVLANTTTAWRNADCDGDGVTNYAEATGADGNPATTADNTDPLSACSLNLGQVTLVATSTGDCDGDGVTNKDEINGIDDNPLTTADNTNPNDGCSYNKVDQVFANTSAGWKALDCDKDGNPNGTDPNPQTATAANDVLTANFGVTSTVNVLSNDDFLAGANTSITKTGGTAGGTVSFNASTGVMSYTPTASEPGNSVTVVYQVCNTATTPNVCASATVTISVPLAGDQDGDGDPDNTDPAPNNSCVWGTGQVLANTTTAWRNADCDGDGVTNYAEATGADGNPATTADNTDPLSACSLNLGQVTLVATSTGDCDGDGVTNKDEINGIDDNPLTTADNTNPNDGCSYNKVDQVFANTSAGWKALDCDKDGNPNGTDPNPQTATAANDVLTANFGVTSTVNVLSNDDFLAGVNTSITKTGGTAGGTVSFNASTGVMSYTPTASEPGNSVTVIYQVCNTATTPNVCASATVTISVPLAGDQDGDGDPDNTDPQPTNSCVWSSSQVLANTTTAWRNADCDGDGVTNYAEATGADGNPATTADNTDPLSACSLNLGQVTLVATSTGDCDGDGVTNKDEINGIDDNPLTTADNTNPNDGCSYNKVDQVFANTSAGWKALDCDKDGNPNGTDPNPQTATAANDVLTANFGVTSTVNVLSNDDFLAGVNTSITKTGGTAGGTVSFNASTGVMSYTPTASEPGNSVTVVYQVCNTATTPNVCASATVTISVPLAGDQDGDGDPDNTDPQPTNSCVWSSSQVLANTTTAWRNADCDGDGVTNYAEATGADGNPATTADNTDPLSACSLNLGQVTLVATSTGDCDGDGVTNKDEINGIDDNPLTTADNTNPNDGCSYNKVDQVFANTSAGWKALDCDKDGNPNGTDPNPQTATAANDVLTANFGVTSTVNVLSNDDFLAGVNTSITKTGGTAGGTVSFNASTGVMSYTPTASEPGNSVTVVYQVCNTAATPNVCASATVTISVPLAGDQDGDGDPDNTDPQPTNSCVWSSSQVLANTTTAWRNADCDGDGVTNYAEATGADGNPATTADNTDPLSACSLNLGQVTLVATSTGDCDGDGVTNKDEINGIDDNPLTPADNTNPNDGCSYNKVDQVFANTSAGWKALDCDKDGNPNGTDPNPQTATATNDVLTANFGVTSTVNVLSNDDFLAGVNTSITKTGGTAGGTVSFNASTGVMSYTPTASEPGNSVTVIYQVCNTLVTPNVCASATVTISVPAAGDQDGDGDPDNTDPQPTNSCVWSSSQVLANTTTAWRNADCDGDGVTNYKEVTGTDNDPLTTVDNTNPNDGCSYNKVDQVFANTSAGWKALDCDKDGNPNGTDPNPQTATANNDVLTAPYGSTSTVSVLSNDDFLPVLSNVITRTGGTASGTVVFAPTTGVLSYTPTVSEPGTTVTVIYQVCNTLVTPQVCASATVSITVPTAPRLSITKASPSGSINAFDNFTYTITVSNLGSATTTGTITVKDTLQSGLSFVSSSTATGWSCSSSGQVVTCTRTSSIPSGSNSSFSLTVTALSNGVYQNKAGVYGGGDPVAINGTTAAQSNNTSVSVGQSVVKLTAKVFLRGAYDTNVGLMLDGLRSQGLIPLVQPYGKGSYTDIPHVGAEEATTTSVLSVTGNNAIVDWVSVELRDKTNPSTILYSRSGLVQRDGDIVDVDGVSCLSFVGAVPESYYVTIRHRNHLGAMTANAIALTSSCSALVDFTSPSLSLYKKATTDPEYTAYPTVDLGSVRALWGGNASPDRFVIYQGPNNDRTFIGSVVLTDAGNTEGLNNYMVTGYLRPDINLDGLVIFQGPGNDVNLLFNEIFTHPENVEKLNNFIIYQQLP